MNINSELDEIRKIANDQKSQIDSLTNQQTQDKLETEKKAYTKELNLLNSINQIKNEVKQIQNIQKCLFVNSITNFNFVNSIQLFDTNWQKMGRKRKYVYTYD